MPELPEVQTVVNDLNKKIIGRKITGVWFDTPAQISLYEIWAGKPKIIKRPRPEVFSALIKGAVIEKIKRRGKNILIYLSKSSKLKAKSLLLIHQKMTGHLLVGKWKIAAAGEPRHWRENKKIQPLGPAPLKKKVNDYIHIIFKLDNGRMLGLSDLRKFAKVLYGSAKEIESLPELLKIGPEPLSADFKFAQFQKIISKEKRKIKQVLMDQEVIAGIGNIYSDDILWQAKIHPFRPAAGLSKAELARVYKSMRLILKKAIKSRGTSISDFRDTAGKAGGYGNIRLVYRRKGEPCGRCKTLIKRVKIGGRSAHFCSKCQSLTLQRS